jgi:hypothetical protein
MANNILVISSCMIRKISYPIINQTKLLINLVVVSIIKLSINLTFQNIDYIDKIDEIRTGYNTRTFNRLVRHKMVDTCDVN